MKNEKPARRGITMGLIGRVAVLMAALLTAWLILLACMAAIYVFKLG